MRNWIVTITVLFVLATALPALAGEDHQVGKPAGSSQEATSGMKTKMTKVAMKGFGHKTVVDGIQAEFQVMRLADMHMSDPEGHTHHIMVKLVQEGSDQPLSDAIGKIKVIAPDKKEQTGVLKRYGDFLAANFTFDVPGNYGVICLFMVNGQKHVVKFWYPHEK
jgi:hypothetical protein